MSLESSAADNERPVQQAEGVGDTHGQPAGQPFAAAGSHGTYPRRILVIEHDVEQADFLVTLLENAGYGVEVATDGQYGLILLDTFEPELILIDTGLTGTSSSDVTQVLRGAPNYGARFRFTRILYMAEQRQIINQRFHSVPAAPISDYIFKPIDTKLLLERVERCFAEIDSAAAASS